MSKHSLRSFRTQLQIRHDIGLKEPWRGVEGEVCEGECGDDTQHRMTNGAMKYWSSFWHYDRKLSRGGTS